MNESILGVAVVGAGPDHWSGAAHIPAIAALDGLRLRGLVTSTPQSAAAASARWGVPASHELSRILDDEDVDIVAATLRVPRHAEVVTAAIAAGKHVYCEWPLAVDTAQAMRLAELSAQHSGQVHVTGLQGRFSPHLGAFGELLRSGIVGEPLTANLRLHLPLGLIPRPSHRTHLRHRAVGADVLSIQAGHALDMLGAVLGSPEIVSARLWSAVPEFLVDTGERLPRDAPDNLIAVLDYSGVVAVCQFSQTGPTELFELELLGTQGALRLSGQTQPQFGGLTLSITPLGSRTAEVLPPRPGLTPNSPLPAGHPGHNVAAAYAALAAAIRAGETNPQLPSFDTAVELHKLLDSIAIAASEQPARSGLTLT